MATNFKAADLIGKTIVVGDNQAMIMVKSVQDNGMLACEFKKTGDATATPLTVTLPNLNGMVEKGLWKVMSDVGSMMSEEKPQTSNLKPQTPEVTTEADVAEVSDIVPVVKPKEQTHPQPLPVSEGSEQTAGKTKPKKQTKPKAKTTTDKTDKTDKPTAQTSYIFETYTNKKNKTCARIIGFKETDEAYVNAAELHGSKSWSTTNDGRVYYMAFGHRYVEAARLVCEALNAGKSFAECKAIVDSKPKSQPSAVSPQTSEKTYTQTELAEWLRKLNAGDPEAAKFFNDLAKAA